MKRRLFKRRTRLKIKIRFSVNLDQILSQERSIQIEIDQIKL